MLTRAYRPEEAARVQALNEQLVFGSIALASIGSGFLLQALSWQAINIPALPLAAVAIPVLALGDLRQRRRRATA